MVNEKEIKSDLAIIFSKNNEEEFKKTQKKYTILSGKDDVTIVFRKRNGLVEKILVPISNLPEKIRENVIGCEEERKAKVQLMKERTKKVVELLKNKEYKKAEDILLDGIGETPTNMYFLTNLIKTYGCAGMTAAAREIFNYALTVDKNNPHIYSMMIIGYGKEKNIEKAEEIYKMACENGLEKVKIKAAIWEVYYHNNEIEKAKEIFKEAKEKKLTTPKMYSVISEYEEKNGKNKEAITLLEMAIEDGKEDCIIHTKLIKLYGKEGKIQDAERIFYGRALHLQDHQTYTAMMDVYIENKMEERARQIFNLLKNNGSKLWTTTAFLRLAREKGDIEEAERLFEEMKSGAYADIASYTMMLSIYEKFKLVEKGERLIEEMLTTQKNDQKSYIRIINFYGKIKEIEKAEAIFKMALNEFPTAETYSAIMAAYYKNKEYEKIIKTFLYAPERIWDNETVLILFLEALRKKKNYENVIELTSVMLERKKEKNEEWDNCYIIAMLIKGYALKDSGKIDDAQKIFCRVLEKISNTNVHYPRAICGLVFCRQVFTKEEAEEIKNNLIFWIDKKDANCCFDIKNALKILEDNYELAFTEDEKKKML